MRKDRISKKIAYITNLYAQEDSMLAQISADITNNDQEIHIGAEEGKFLQVVMRLGKVKKIVEIGTHFAYSTIWMARALPRDGKIITIEKNPQRALKAQENLKKLPNCHQIELIEGNANKILGRIEEQGPFDMIFIDADKISYPGYLAWAYENLRIGGILIADNTLFFGDVYGEKTSNNRTNELIKSLQEFNLLLADSLRFTSILIPTEEGLSIGVKV